jgi:uncharacterized protein (DUF2236 family)
MDPRTLSSGEFRRLVQQQLPWPTDPKMGVFGPDSLTWRINREVVLHSAGPRALLMQMAHPKVAQGVADHSNFREDPYGRAIRTFSTVYSMLFGTREEVSRASARVHSVHKSVEGTLAHSSGRHKAGSSYHANDPELLRWVFATLIDSAIFAYDLLVQPLSEQEKALCYQESLQTALLFGLSSEHLPGSWPAFSSWLEDTLESDEIVISPIGYELGDILLRGPYGLRPFAPGLRIITAGMLHPKLRQGYGLGWRRRTRFAYEAFVRATRAALKSAPGRLRHVPVARKAEERCRSGRGPKTRWFERPSSQGR